MSLLDRDCVQFTDEGTQAGDDAEAVTWLDKIDELAGSKPYCFRLKSEHPEGAQGSIARYTPWWKHLKENWGPIINKERIKFTNWNKDRFTKNSKVATHVLMNSGELCVPIGHEEDQFLESMAKCLCAGMRMYAVELIKYDWPVPCFRLFVDLDFKQLSGITERGIEAAASICAITVSKFFSTKSITIVTSTTYKEDSTVDSNGLKIQRIKTGAHLYWPDYYVTALQAMHIRESLLVDLSEVCGTRIEPQQNSWDDVVDRSVYGDAAMGKQGSGLRMVGNSKTAVCKECKGRKREGQKCENCDGLGKVNDLDIQGRVGRPYMMLCVLTKPKERINATSGQPKVEHYVERSYDAEEMYLGPEGFYKLLCDTKIRTCKKEDSLDCGFELPAGAPLFLSSKKRFRDGPAGSIIKRERRIEPSDPIVEAAQKIIRESFGPLYSSIQVRQVTKAPKGLHYTVTISGQNCRYCQNIGREHTSNNIFFVISKEGISQRCFDDGAKTPEMKHGTCKEYSGGLLPIGASAMNILWPESQEAFSEIFIDTFNNDSFYMRALVNLGEFLSTQAHGTSWISTLNLKPQGKGPQKKFLPMDPRDLGNKGIQAYKDLGMSWADALVTFTQAKHPEVIDDIDEQGPRKSISAFEKDVLEAFQAVIVAASAAEDPSIFLECQSFDDFVLLRED
jgi:hypothetical protein